MTASSSNIWDVIIAGAGPAGSTLARLLAAQGARTLVLERESLPRHKVCAGGVTVRAADLLDFSIKDVVEDTTSGLRLTYRYGPPLVKTYDKPIVYQVTREKFDSLLVARARETGASVLEQHQVTGVLPEEGGVKVTTVQGEFRGRVLVGADGVRSVVARRLGLWKEREIDVALEAYVPCDSGRLRDWANLIHINYGDHLHGYGWVFPKDGCLSVGVCSTERWAGKLRASYTELVRRWGLGDSAIPPFRSSILSVRSERVPIVQGRCLLLGDAAGLLDAVTGEGIYYAIRSAQLAAPAILSCLRGNEDALAGYEMEVNAQLMPDIRISQKLARIAARMPRLMYNFMTGSDLAWKAACRILRGETQYSKLHWGLRNYLKSRHGS